MALTITTIRLILLICLSGILVVIFQAAFIVEERHEATVDIMKEVMSNVSFTTKTRAATTLNSSSSSMAAVPLSPSSSVPKILWMYWDKGLDHLKEMSHNTEPNNEKYRTGYACVQAWKILHPSWNVRFLNITEAKQFAPNFAKLIDDGNERNIPICPVKLCDLLRLELLTRYGGVYVDTSVCPMRPLDDFIDKQLGRSSRGFYAPPLGVFRRKGRRHRFVAGAERSQLKRFVGCDRIASATSTASSRKAVELASDSRSMSTWFLVARPHNTLVEQWMWAYYKLLTDLVQSDCAKKCRHYGRPRACVCACIPYFVVHCVFTLQRLHQESVEAMWTGFVEHIHRHNPIGVTNQDMGVCSGKSLSSSINKNVTFTRETCYLVKKQHGNLARFVSSPVYLESMAEKVAV